ncbi:MAG: primosomal protein N' [Deltaproteobacteria bacterium]|nr:primosomal protein N' [Deltaproteobacteria bacterium]
MLEVAVALPVDGVFVYRDLPGAGSLPSGSQVVVSFRGRKVAGFVVGHPQEPPPDAPKEILPILRAVGDGPVFDEAILDLCRWAAGYYLAPLGEVLCAAVPSGERASSSRRLRLTEAGRAAIDANRSSRLAAMALDADDRALLARIKKARSLSQGHMVRSSAAASRRVGFLIERGFVEVTDGIRGARATPKRVGVEGCGTVFAAGESLPRLNVHQEAAFATLLGALGKGYATFLLQGITGSGKTEIYLRIIAEARKRGHGALVLVPEIALTPQLAARFRARFGDDVAVLHSAVPPGERAAAWRRLRRGEVGIALGARSAVFAPVRDLAVVVVDEEHDGSFKQEDGFRYHARDLAIMRASQGRALAVLGSATPCLETYRNALLGRFGHLLLPVRANPAAAARPLPTVEVIDLRQHPPGSGGILSPPLAMAVERTLAAGEQSILFLNRRGFSTVVHCRACGLVLRCKACAVSLTLHQARGRLLCHYCGRVEPIRKLCPQCGSPSLEGMGTGTERVESQVRERFPGARVARLDRDTADGGRGRIDELLAEVGRGDIDILIGTQMVTKGHDFGNVTLVGILQPDQGIHLPDFRAAERTFQLMEQVAGRAGRGERPGRIMVQTYDPEHPAIRFLVRHDYDGFARDELARREAAGYPPFTRTVVLRLEGKDAREVERAAHAVAGRARAASAASSLRVLGPGQAPIARLRGRARFQVWLSGADRAKLLSVSRATQHMSLSRNVRLEVDVDPQSVL